MNAAPGRFLGSGCRERKPLLERSAAELGAVGGARRIDHCGGPTECPIWGVSHRLRDGVFLAFIAVLEVKADPAATCGEGSGVGESNTGNLGHQAEKVLVRVRYRPTCARACGTVVSVRGSPSLMARGNS
jgi:hypothetical protein